VVAGRLLTEMILPVSQFFAYLEVDETGGSTFDMPDSSLWTLYQRFARRWSAAVDAQGQRPQPDLSGVSRPLSRRRKQEKAAP